MTSTGFYFEPKNIFTKMEYRNYQKSERQKILDFYYENFCKNLPLVKIFGGIPEDELRNNFEPTYGSMLEDGIYGLSTKVLGQECDTRLAT